MIGARHQAQNTSNAPQNSIDADWGEEWKNDLCDDRDTHQTVFFPCGQYMIMSWKWGRGRFELTENPEKPKKQMSSFRARVRIQMLVSLSEITLPQQFFERTGNACLTRFLVQSVSESGGSCSGFMCFSRYPKRMTGSRKEYRIRAAIEQVCSSLGTGIGSLEHKWDLKEKTRFKSSPLDPLEYNAVEWKVAQPST